MRVFDLDRWNEIWQTIARNRKRSIMTAFGVFWGVFMLVVLLSFGLGIGNMFKSNLGGMSTNSAFIFPNRTSVPYKGMPVGRWWRASMDDVINISKIEGIKYVAPIYWGRSANASIGNLSGDYTVAGRHPDYQKIDPLEIIDGRFLNEIDEDLSRKSCVIGEGVNNTLFRGVSPIGKVIKVNSSYYTVVGVIKQKNLMMNMGTDPEESIFIPSTLYRQLYGLGNSVDALALTGEDDVDIDIAFDEAKRVVASGNLISPNDKQAVDGFSFSREFKRITSLVNGILALTWIVGIGTLLAGIVGISNIMLVTVRERTQEIGIRRALGARPMTIISQILSESFILTFIAGIMGLTAAVGLMSVLGPALSNSMNVSGGGGDFVGPSFQISFGLGLLCAAIIIFGSLLAGIIPASRAIKIKAVDAIREE